MTRKTLELKQLQAKNRLFRERNLINAELKLATDEGRQPVFSAFKGPQLGRLQIGDRLRASVMRDKRGCLVWIGARAKGR